jgi:hypothetical protein
MSRMPNMCEEDKIKKYINKQKNWLIHLTILLIFKWLGIIILQYPQIITQKIQKLKKVI